MTHWNYRVTRRRFEGSDEELLEIREVYYSSQDDSVIEGWVLEPSGPRGETEEELRSDWEGIGCALEKPILEFDELPRGNGV